MLLFKTIRYHLVTNPSQRIQDQAEFEILSGDVKQKARQLAEMERRLISADGCLRTEIKTQGDNATTDSLTGYEITGHCAAFCPKTHWACTDARCPHSADNYRYFAASRAYDEAVAKEKKFWPERRKFRIEQAVRERQELAQQIAYTDAQCADLENELASAKNTITNFMCAKPDCGPLVKKGCFVSLYYVPADWPDLGQDEQSAGLRKKKKCEAFAVPCSQDCPYHKRNKHYSAVLARYNAACAAYRLLTGKKWTKTK